MTPETPETMNIKCFKCKYREVFKGSKGSTLSLCMADPYDYDLEVTWLDVSNFDSDKCLFYKKDEMI